jgi:hypothetical protein
LNMISAGYVSGAGLIYSCAVWKLMPLYTKVQGLKSRSSEARLISSPVKNFVYSGIYYH